MTTLAKDTFRAEELGVLGDYPFIASDIGYEGSAAGDNGAGYARPLVGGDEFLGFIDRNVDNSAGAAGDKYVRVKKEGYIQLSISGLVITDVGQEVYATDDNTFVCCIATGASYIGVVSRFVSSGVGIVKFKAGSRGKWHGKVAETISDNKTLAVADSGKVFFVDTDAKVVTLPATAVGLLDVVVVNGGAFGTILVSIDPDNADKIIGCALSGGDGKKLNNTKATAKRGDYAKLSNGHADGALLQELKGTWAMEA